MSRDHAVIDTDIHAVLSAHRIMERLPEPWRTRWASGNRGPGHRGGLVSHPFVPDPYLFYG